MMMDGNAYIGTSLKDSFKDPTRLQQKEINDDFDLDYSSFKALPHEVSQFY